MVSFVAYLAIVSRLGSYVIFFVAFDTSQDLCTLVKKDLFICFWILNNWLVFILIIVFRFFLNFWRSSQSNYWQWHDWFRPVWLLNLFLQRSKFGKAFRFFQLRILNRLPTSLVDAKFGCNLCRYIWVNNLITLGCFGLWRWLWFHSWEIVIALNGIISLWLNAYKDIVRLSLMLLGVKLLVKEWILIESEV